MDFMKNKKNVIVFAFLIFVMSMLIGGYVAYNAHI